MVRTDSSLISIASFSYATIIQGTVEPGETPTKRVRFL